MKKFSLVFLLILCACSSNNSIYTNEEIEQLKSFNVYEEANSEECKNKDLVKTMLQTNLNASYISSYCSLQTVNPLTLNQMLDVGVSLEEIEGFNQLSNFHIEKLDRYLNYEGTDLAQRVLDVNMDMDLEPYSSTTLIEDDSDMAMLINKFSSLPDGYIPSDLVDVTAVCTLNVHYSCTTMNKVQLRSAAAIAFDRFVIDAKKEGIDILAIACYRDYAYQFNLYNYYKDLYGIEYADMYYARPGQSEHNSGLAVDIMFNEHNFNEIELYEGYDWILENMSNYGFILRYPEDKQNITRYGYESWHLRYVGEETAKTIYENDWVLEEYYGNK